MIGLTISTTRQHCVHQHQSTVGRSWQIPKEENMNIIRTLDLSAEKEASPKLTVRWVKMDGWNTNFLLGLGLFSGASALSCWERT